VKLSLQLNTVNLSLTLAVYAVMQLLKFGDIRGDWVAITWWILGILIAADIVIAIISMYLWGDESDKLNERLVLEYKKTGRSDELNLYIALSERPAAGFVRSANVFTYVFLALKFLKYSVIPPPQVEAVFLAQDRNWLNVFWIPVRIMRNRQRRALTVVANRGSRPR
jgi:hypothetical protein